MYKNNGNKPTPCILEQTGCDMSCLVCSVAQVLLDPYYRTLTGFQALIQKEWVRMSHPFQRYLSLVTTSDSDTEQVSQHTVGHFHWICQFTENEK